MRTIEAMFVGAIIGAVLGAVSLVLTYYAGERSTLLFSTGDMAIISAYIGAMFGWVPGVAVGLVVGIVKSNNIGSTVLGGMVGVLTLIVLLLGFGSELLYAGLISVPVCALIGFISGRITG